MDEFASPLHWAIQEGLTLIAHVLIVNGVDTNQLDSNQRSPLDLALEKDYFHVIIALVKNQADVNFESVEIGPLLFYTISKYQVDIYAKLMIDKGANVNCTTIWNQTPLHAAAYYGDTNIAKVLIQKGAKIDAQTNLLQTPLLLAARQGDIEIVEMLLNNGANDKIRDHLNNEPIHYAAKYGYIQCAKILIEHGANLNTRGADGYRPLEQALENKTLNSFKFITFVQSSL